VAGALGALGLYANFRDDSPRVRGLRIT
jgi:hypothetical protein